MLNKFLGRIIGYWLPLQLVTSAATLPAGAQQKYTDSGYRPITPDVYAFFKYADTPVNKYNGVADISIPIHSIKLDGKDFPFAFTYHSGGIRVDEEASWIGLGWDLRLPTIVQTINDEDDFRINSLHPQNVSFLRPDYPAYSMEYPMSPSVASGSGTASWSSPYPSTGLADIIAMNAYTVSTNYDFPVNRLVGGRYPDFFEQVYNYIDSEPDIFSATVFGEQLTFVRHFGSGQIEVLNHKDYAVERRNLEDWLITDPDGYQYSFTQKQIGYSKMNYDTPFSNTSNGTYVPTPSTVTWYLTAITSPKNNAVTINYATMQADHLCNRHNEKYVNTKYDSYSGYGGAGGQNVRANYPFRIPGVLSRHIYETNTEVRERRVYPSSIVAPDVSISFNVTNSRLDADNSPQLSSINIVGQPSGGSKTFTLQQDYFQANNSGIVHSPLYPNGDNPLKRLRLTSLNNSNSGTYIFSYDSEPLPSRYSYAQDYWGFYNGSTDNTTLVPNATAVYGGSAMQMPYQIANNNHDAQLRYARAGTLIGVTYPTGGSTKYVYELNTFLNYPAPNYNTTANTASGNGLRIKEIRNYSGAGQLAYKEEFEYSGGQCLHPVQFVNSVTYYDFVPATSSGNTSLYGTMTYYLVEEINPNGQYSPATTGSGTGVGYSKVKQRRTGTLRGTTITYYTNNPDIVSWSNHGYSYVTGSFLNLNLPAYPAPSLRKTGAVDSVILLDAGDGRIQKTDFIYTSINSAIHYGARPLSSGLYYQLQSGSGGFNWQTFSRDLIGFYPIYTKRLLKNQETTTMYSPGGTPYRISTTYTYDTFDRVTEVVKSGRMLKEVSTYTYPTTTSSQGQGLLNQHRLSEVIAYTYRRGLIGSVVDVYPLYQYTKQYQAHSRGPVVSQVNIQESANGTDVRSYTYNYENFDNKGRVGQTSRSNGSIITYIWHASYDQLLAEIKSGSAGPVAYTSFESGDNGNWTFTTTSFLAGEITGKAHHDLSTFNVLSPILTPGTYLVTLWAKNGTPTCQIPNAATGDQVTVKTLTTRPDGWTQYQYTAAIVTNGVRLEFPAGQANTNVWIDEARLHPAGAQMTTFHESSLQGMNATTDPSGRLMNYEYDAGNRLQRVRDEQQRLLVEHQYHFANP